MSRTIRTRKGRNRWKPTNSSLRRKNRKRERDHFTSNASLKYCVAFESRPGSSVPAGDVLKKLISSSAA